MTVEHVSNKHKVKQSTRAECGRTANPSDPDSFPWLCRIRSMATQLGGIRPVFVFAGAKRNAAALEVWSASGLHEVTVLVADGCNYIHVNSARLKFVRDRMRQCGQR